jgi:hypothetical protein
MEVTLPVDQHRLVADVHEIDAECRHDSSLEGDAGERSAHGFDVIDLERERHRRSLNHERDPRATPPPG